MKKVAESILTKARLLYVPKNVLFMLDAPVEKLPVEIEWFLENDKIIVQKKEGEAKK